jgi:hypothetical protein
MKNRSLLPALAVLIIFIGGCGNRSADEQSGAEPEAIDSLFAAYSDFRLRINP